MTGRSLRATPEGIQKLRKAIKHNGWKQEELKDELGLKTRQPITRLLAGEPIERSTFEELCHLLDLTVAEIAAPEGEQSSEAIDIDGLVQQIKSIATPKIKDKIGWMRMLPNRWVLVDEIYVQLKVLEPPTHDRLFVDQCHQFQAENNQIESSARVQRFERIGLTQATQEPKPALHVLAHHPKAIILGKPESGKTTLLRSLAVECVQEKPKLEELKQLVPVFLILRNVAKDFAKELDDRERLVLLKAIRWEIQSWGQVEPESIESLLKAGKLFLLLDGLDEVPEQYGEAIVNQIRQFCDQYGDTRILVTCRTQQQQYRFDSTLSDIEIDNFQPEQVRQFVQNWFTPVRREEAQALISQLESPENKPIAELAVTPILLNLVCVVADRHQGDLPKNRASLYEQGIRALLTDWDEFEGKDDRQRRSKLSVDEKEALLAHVALTLFEQNNLVPEQRTLEQLIGEKLDVSRAEAVQLLKSFETEHGLLVERDRGYWSFSHLTFQEYFVARAIVAIGNSGALQRLTQNITEKRWREMFLLTASMMRNADELVQAMKQKIDQLIVKDGDLQQFLKWLSRKSISLNNLCYTQPVLRAYYFLLGFNYPRFREQNIAFALDQSLERVAADLSDDDTLLDYLHNFDKPDFDNKPSVNRFSYFKDYVNLLLEDFPEACEFKNFIIQTPEFTWEEYQKLNEWWQINGHAWTDQLRSLLIKYRNIGHDWQFTEAQEQLLQQYYDASKLLVDCLKNGDSVSRKVREAIEDTLLLPIEVISSG